MTIFFIKRMEENIFKRIFFGLALVLISVILALSIAEIWLRVTGYRYTPLKIEAVAHSEWRYYHIFEDKHFVYDSHLIWRPRKNFSIFNSQGYRGQLLTLDKKPGEFRIFAFGDSNTLGWAGENGPNWPGYLQQILKEKGKRGIVINAGVWGYSSYQGLRYLKESLGYKPDIILISFGANDAHRVSTPDDKFLNINVRLAQALQQFRIGHLFLALYYRKHFDKKTFPRVDVETFENNLHEIVEICKTRNIKVFLLTRPYLGSFSEQFPNWWKNFAPAYRKATLAVADEDDGTPVIDLYSYFMNKTDYFADESHFNEAGHRLAAQVVYNQIQSTLP